MSRRKRPSKPRFGDAYRPIIDPLRMTGDFRIASMHHIEDDTPLTTLHIHDVLEIGYCHEGEGVFVVDEKVLPFGTGCASVISEREFHLARSSPGKQSSWTFHHVDAISLLGASPDFDVVAASRLGGKDFPNVLWPQKHPELCHLIKEFDLEVWANAPGSRAALRGLLLVILARLQRIAPPEDAAEATGRQAALRRVAPALAVIVSHYAESLELSDLASACDLSVTHFRRLFRVALGQSPADYLARFRVHKASALLAGDRKPVLEAAFACGFNSLSAFSRQFREVFGQSPRAFRAQRRSA